MKKLTASILSLCLALLLGLSLLGTQALAAGDTFLITGYNVRSDSIEKGDSVDVTVYLSRTDGASDEVSLVRALDSFSGGSFADDTVSGTNGSYTVTLKNLVYSGEDRALSFTVYFDGGYETLSLTVRECVPYTAPAEEDPETPEAAPAPRVIFSSRPLSAPIKANASVIVSVEVKNAGSTALKSPLLTIDTSDSLMIPGGQNSFSLDTIRAGESRAVLVTVQALGQISSQNQYLTPSLTYYYDNNISSNTAGEASGRITLLSDTGSSAASGGLRPVLILSGYHYGGGSIAAGSEELVNISFTNTSRTTAVENVMLTVSGNADLMINGSTNTFYYSSIAAGGTQTLSIPFKAAQIISANSADVSLAFSYEYLDGGSYASGSADLSVNIPLYQPDRFEFSDPKVAGVGYVGDQNTITLDYVNKGKGLLYNVEARISGDVDSVNATQRIGNIEAGKTGTIAFAVTPYTEGETPVIITISYEDANGNLQERVFEYALEAMAFEPIDPGEWEEPTYEEPKAAFPWWIVIAVAIVAAIVVLSVLRKKKKKARLAAEAAMWDDWDDEKPAVAEEAQKETAASEETK